MIAFSLLESPPDLGGTPGFFGPYELRGEIGRGGMGVVHRAWDPKLERIVALKLLLAGPFATESFALRFQREARLAARLRHPGIVAVFDTGEAESQPFYTMELVEGRNLSSLLHEAPLPPNRAALILARVAEAVEHAHREGVLHCDLKPSNILITEGDLPKVADFGLAKLWRESSEITVEGSALGSPSFMAPEQAAGRRRDIGPTTDVYGLGAVLYHALTGRPPHTGGTVQEVLAMVRDAPVLGVRLLNPSVPRDLETVCLKALDKESPRRYATAAEFAEDLYRFTRGEPVDARPISALEKGWRWARRNRALTAALSILAVVCLLSAVGVVWQMERNIEERERLELEGYASGIKAASMAATEGHFPLARSYLSALIPAKGRPDRRGFEWRYLWATTAPDDECHWQPHTGQINGIHVSPGGDRVVTTSFDGEAKVWQMTIRDPGRHNCELVPLWRASGNGWGPSFSPDGSLFVSSEGKVGQWIFNQNSTQVVWQTAGWQTSLSKAGHRLAISRSQPFLWEPPKASAQVWEVGSENRLLFETPMPVRTTAISPDGRILAAATEDRRIALWSIDTGKQVQSLTVPANQFALCFSPDGRSLASCGRGRAWIWQGPFDVDATPSPRMLEHPWLNLWSVAFSPDSELLVTTCSDRGVRVWDVPSGRLLRQFHGHSDEVWSACFHPDGNHLLTGGKDGSLFLWRLRGADDESQRVYAHQAWGPVRFSSASKDVTGCLANDRGGTTVWSSDQGTQKRGPAGWLPCGYSSDGMRLLMWGSAPPFLRWWRVVEGAFGESFEGSEPYAKQSILQTGVSSDGHYVFQVLQDGRLQVWDAEIGSLPRTCKLPSPQLRVSGAALFSNERFALSRASSSACWLVDLRKGEVCSLQGHSEDVKGVAFSPDGQWLATASSDGRVGIWDVSRATLKSFIRAHTESASDVAFSPDGRTLSSVGTHQSIVFWHLPTGRELFSLSLPEVGSFLRFSPDGLRLAVTLETEPGRLESGARVFSAPWPEDMPPRPR